MGRFASSIYKGQFIDCNVVVIGAARGIGKGLAGAFAEAGASVAIIDLNDKIHETAKELCNQGFEVASFVANATDDKNMKSVFEAIGKKWTKLDVLVNNAGIIEINELENTETDSFRKVLDVNTVAQFIACREALPLLRKSERPVIINAASGQARQGFIFTPSYAASKMGVIGLTQSLAKELGKENIRVNAYCPGIVATDMWEYNDSEWRKRLGKDLKPGELMKQWYENTPLGRASTNEDVANTVLFLASDAASCITGQAINIDGGMFMN